MDALVLQMQNNLAKLEKIGAVAAETDVVMKRASAVLKDAEASRQVVNLSWHTVQLCRFNC